MEEEQLGDQQPEGSAEAAATSHNNAKADGHLKAKKKCNFTMQNKKKPALQVNCGETLKYAIHHMQWQGKAKGLAFVYDWWYNVSSC